MLKIILTTEETASLTAFSLSFPVSVTLKAASAANISSLSDPSTICSPGRRQVRRATFYRNIESF